MRLAAGTRIEASAVLFDMDGTLVDSRSVIENVWGRWTARHGIDWDALRHAMHGVQIADTVRRFAPAGLDIAREVEALMAAELTEVGGLVAIRGAADLLAALPAPRWAVVTSAVREMARIRIEAAGLPQPSVLVAAEDVAHGKPHPEGFATAARALGAAGPDILVFEDSPAGMDAGRAAGFRTIGIAATRHTPFPDSDEWIEDFASLNSAPTAETGRIVLNVT